MTQWHTSQEYYEEYYLWQPVRTPGTFPDWSNILQKWIGMLLKEGRYYQSNTPNEQWPPLSICLKKRIGGSSTVSTPRWYPLALARPLSFCAHIKLCWPLFPVTSGSTSGCRSEMTLLFLASGMGDCIWVNQQLSSIYLHYYQLREGVLLCPIIWPIKPPSVASPGAAYIQRLSARHPLFSAAATSDVVNGSWMMSLMSGIWITRAHKESYCVRGDIGCPFCLLPPSSYARWQLWKQSAAPNSNCSLQSYTWAQSGDEVSAAHHLCWQ